MRLLVYTEADKFQKAGFRRKSTRARAEKSEKAMKPCNQGRQRLGGSDPAFFVSAFIPPQKVRARFSHQISDNLYAVGSIFCLWARLLRADRDHGCDSVFGSAKTLFAGKDRSGLELVKDYGFLAIIAKPLFWLMENIHALLGNWGGPSAVHYRDQTGIVPLVCRRLPQPWQK